MATQLLLNSSRVAFLHTVGWGDRRQGHHASVLMSACMPDLHIQQYTYAR